MKKIIDIFHLIFYIFHRLASTSSDVFADKNSIKRMKNIESRTLLFSSEESFTSFSFLSKNKNNKSSIFIRRLKFSNNATHHAQLSSGTCMYECVKSDNDFHLIFRKLLPFLIIGAHQNSFGKPNDGDGNDDDDG